MKHIKIRHIIGTLAIIAIVVMNFTYAHNNYGIPKMSGVTKAYATTQPLGYRHTFKPDIILCIYVEYRVTVHYYTHSDTLGRHYYVTTTERFLDFDKGKAYNKAKQFASSIQGPNYAELDKAYSLTYEPYETFRKECDEGGKLKECTTEDASCESYVVS